MAAANSVDGLHQVLNQVGVGAHFGSGAGTGSAPGSCCKEPRRRYYVVFVEFGALGYIVGRKACEAVLE